MTNKIIYKFTLLTMVALFLENCGAVKPKVSASASTKKEANKISAVNNGSKNGNETQYVLKIETPVETDGVTYLQTVKVKPGEASTNKNNSSVQHSNNEKINIKANKRLTIGPEIAIFKLPFEVVHSFSRLAMPPRKKSVMSLTFIPSPIATKECANSCNKTDKNKRNEIKIPIIHPLRIDT